MTPYPLRLIEVDLPIARISAHARREKSIRHGHISTLHIWWARRPLAACRAVILASLWPDPVDLAAWAAEADGHGQVRAPRTPPGGKPLKPGEGVVIRPARFLDEARRRMTRWAKVGIAKAGKESGDRLNAVEKNPRLLDDPAEGPRLLRALLLDFIADFADWDHSTDTDYLETARALTQAAHEALGGEPGTRPLVIDPFAGGGSIPLEALRVGADAFASDLNPIPVLLNKVVLEYIPKYGQRLADEVRKWGQWIKEQAEKELAQFYPKDADSATPIAYLWARTILSEAPGEGDCPVEVPLMRSLWLAKKANRRRALRWVRDGSGKVKTETVEVTYATEPASERRATRVKRPLLEIFEPAKESDVEGGTVARGSATCPVTGFTTRVESVRAQLKKRRGGAADARLFCIVTTRSHEQGRFYRLPTRPDTDAFDAAAVELKRRTINDERGPMNGSADLSFSVQRSTLSLVPDEPLPPPGGLGFRVQPYGMTAWGDLFTPRQLIALTTLARLVREVGKRLDGMDAGLAEAVQACLALMLTKQSERDSSLCRWISQNENIGYTFGRQALPMMWDYVESPTIFSGGGWRGILTDSTEAIETLHVRSMAQGMSQQASAISHALPDGAASFLVTDPPYYDAVPYSDLSDFFYVWLKRVLPAALLPAFIAQLTPKDDECILDDAKMKDKAFFERMMRLAMTECRRVVQSSGVGVVVFAHKSTAGWETQLQAMIAAGWIVTGSWPIDTERPGRLRAQESAALSSSVHLVVRPRENTDGSLATTEVGEWREVLAELPRKMEEWMPRLAAEGVVGADAIFACLGPALEVFSRYSRVEKSSGEAVTLKEYLVHVWAAVSTEALSLIIKDADASGLEPDARLTAVWLWTVGGKGKNDERGTLNDEEEEGGEEETSSFSVPRSSFVLEFDAARLIAQGLGVHLEKSESIVEVKGETARLLPVAERTRYLFGKDAAADSGLQGAAAPRGRRKKAQASLFQSAEEIRAEIETAEAESAGRLAAGRPGATILDRVHQAMLLFSAGRGEALRRFIVDDGVGKDGRFWKLAQSLSALYPTGTDEKRWVDGVLARKKSFGN